MYQAFNTTVQLNTSNLQALGFTPNEINTLTYLINNNGRITTNVIQQYGFDYETAKKLKYMYDISSGKTQITNKEELAKHLRKLFGTHKRIEIQNLPLSRVREVPRLAVVGGIPNEPFNIYNSNNYSNIKDKLYLATEVSNNKITIETSRRPVLKYGAAKKVDGIVEIKTLLPNNKLKIAIDKRYAKLCNRYIIVGSLRRPEFHLGLVEIICMEGTKVYVYAQDIGTSENVRYREATQRVYAYGFNPEDISKILLKVSQEMYKMILGVTYTIEKPTKGFKLLTIEKPVQPCNSYNCETLED